uniref:uncharacterized protein LOC122593931 n=1 Tax=Erigeron canadensis TaxID=72917 RepID=UPI001CB8DFEB|nr:uncharacterized protein LOC122593931 [Erigeron canadensis]
MKIKRARMGNCIIRQNKIMQTGWEVTEHKEHMKVDGVLPELVPVCGQMYYPVPVSIPSVETSKSPDLKAESEDGNGAVRIKLVITKQELAVMLKKGGVSVGELLSHMKKESSHESVVIEDEHNKNCGRWKPVLDSIPEVS